MGVALVAQHVMNVYQDALGNVVLATEVTHNTSNKNEDFSYKCECVNT